MRVDAGAIAPTHSHNQLEQIYILDGEFHDEHNCYKKGDFVVRAPGELHTGGSNTGARLLVYYSK
tara:strand:- start:49 stop:243 length:195 start_codon:yes stop_codon:yes gene_type:complete